MKRAKNSGESGLRATGRGRCSFRRTVIKSTRAIIRDGKLRGEWVESLFVARSQEEGIPPLVPWGERKGYDNVVGWPGDFWAVQVKSTMSRLANGGYELSIWAQHQRYEPGAFDFLAAHVIPKDAWYIIPEKEIRGMKSVTLCSEENRGKYEQYREAWHLLKRPKKEQAKVGQVAGCAERVGLPAGWVAGVLRKFVAGVGRAYGEHDFARRVEAGERPPCA